MEGTPTLDIELGMYSTAKLSRGEKSFCLAKMRAEANSSAESTARDLLSQMKLKRYGSELVVFTSLAAPKKTSGKCLLDVVTPSACNVNVRGCFAHVEFLNLTGTVSASLPYSMVGLFHTTGKVDVNTGPEGRIVFAGSQGDVRLKSGGEIDLKITDPSFRGSLQANSREMPIRILLPLGFLSSFEATGSDVICRADVASKAHRIQQGGLVMLRHGADMPNLRLFSVAGPIVIDNAVEGHT